MKNCVMVGQLSQCINEEILQRSSNFQDITMYYTTRTHRRIIAGQTGLIVTDLCLAFSLTQEEEGEGGR